MGLFDDLLGNISNLGDAGQAASDAAGQMAEDATAPIQDKVTEVTEQLPENPADAIGGIFGDQNQE